MKKSTQLSAVEVRAIQALISKGNSPEVISEVLKIPKKHVVYVLRNLKKFDPILEPKSIEQREIEEQIEDFTRILVDKKSSAEIGAKLFEHISELSEDYMHNFKADSICKFKWKPRYVGITALSDFHIGHEGVDYKRLQHDINVIAKTPNMFIAFLGDTIDNFINEKHLGAIINAVSSPKQQLYMLQHLLSMLKDPKAKILFVTKDNHVSNRLKKATGIDWSNKMWDDYGVFYGGEEVRCELYLGKQQYNILARHSFRGQSSVHLTAGAKKLLREGMYEDIDVVMLAHKHEGAAELFSYRGRPRLAIQTSTYKLLDPYASHLGFHPPTVFMPCIILSPETKDFILCPNVDVAAEMLGVLNKKYK